MKYRWHRCLYPVPACRAILTTTSSQTSESIDTLEGAYGGWRWDNFEFGRKGVGGHKKIEDGKEMKWERREEVG